VISQELIDRREARSKTLEKNAFLMQSAYALVRKHLGKPLTSEQTELMWRVSDVRVSLLKMLPMGRSNVVGDVEKCDEQETPDVHSTYRAVEARRYRVEVLMPTDEAQVNLLQAALTAAAGAGSCGDHSNLAMHLLGRVVQDSEFLIKETQDPVYEERDGKVVNTSLDHSWVRVQAGEGDTAVICDAWAEGPVILPEDCAFIKGKDIKVLWNLDAHQAREANQSFMGINFADFEPHIAHGAVTRQRKEQQALSAKVNDTRSDHDDQLELKPAESTESVTKVVTWGETSALHGRDFLAKLKKIPDDVDNISNGDKRSRKQIKADRLVLAGLKEMALEIASTSPHFDQFQDIKGLADAILDRARNLGQVEDRSLIALPPLALGLIGSTTPRS
jgi:hypothetical protein